MNYKNRQQTLKYAVFRKQFVTKFTDSGKILSGDTKDPKLGTLKAIARVLGCTLDDFDDRPTEKSIEPSYEDVEQLIARGGKDFSTEQKMRLIKLLSELD